MVNYSFQGQQEKIVKVSGKFLPISTKTSFEIASAIRGKKVDNAISILENVSEGKEPLQFKRYLKDTPHRRGKMTAGRYPKKASLNVIKLLKLLKSNAEDKNLSSEELRIIHSAAHKGPNITHPGRNRGKRKITHFEIVAEEVEKKKEKPKFKPKKEEKKVEKKVEEKPAKSDSKDIKKAKAKKAPDEKKEEPKPKEKPKTKEGDKK